MPVTHLNRKRDTHYLHFGKTKSGKPKYWFAKSALGLGMVASEKKTSQ
jgi:hypothetical protein